jgi:hypothetical protein
VGCQGLYASSLPDYNRCPDGTVESWSAEHGGAKHTCLDASHRAQGPVRAWDTAGHALRLAGTYRDGIPIGAWSEWTDTMERRTVYDANGKRTSEADFDLHGKLIDHAQPPRKEEDLPTASPPAAAKAEGDEAHAAATVPQGDPTGPSSADVNVGEGDVVVRDDPVRPASLPAPDNAAPWDGELTFGARGAGTLPSGGYAYVAEARAYYGVARWPKAHGLLYAGLGLAGTLGQSLLSPCRAGCPDALTGSIGPEGRVGLATMYRNETTERRQAAFILYAGAAPTLRFARAVDTLATTPVFALRLSLGLSVPYAWKSYANASLGKNDFKPPYFLPNHAEVVYEVTTPAYLYVAGAWGGAVGYSF